MSPVVQEWVKLHLGSISTCPLKQVMETDAWKMTLMENKCYLMLDLCTPKATLKFMGDFFFFNGECNLHSPTISLQKPQGSSGYSASPDTPSGVRQCLILQLLCNSFAGAVISCAMTFFISELFRK